MINVVDPDVIVLGGGVSRIARLYTDVPPLLGAATCSPTPRSPPGCSPPSTGDSSGVRGAAWLWS